MNRRIAKQTVRRAVARTAKTTGLLSFYGRSSWRTQRLLILCYHGISLHDEHLWNPGLYIDRDTFRARMQMLRAAQCHVLPLPEALARLEQGTLPPRSVVLTIDDGSYDFYALGAPILQEFGFPATVYLTTCYCQHQLPVFNTICSYLLWKARGMDPSLDGILPEGGEVDTRGMEEWLALSRRLIDYTRRANLSDLAKDELAAQLAERLGFDYSALRDERVLHLMNPEEVSQLSKQGIAFELHTHRHITPNDPVLFRREIEDNAAAIREITGSSPRHFCYPSGDYLPQFFSWLRELGVESATTCDPGLMERGIDAMCIPRLLDMPTTQAAEIESWIAGFTPWLRARLGRPVLAENPYKAARLD